MDPGIEICQGIGILCGRTPQNQPVSQLDWQFC
jgi:hypothetical protein